MREFIQFSLCPHSVKFIISEKRQLTVSIVVTENFNPCDRSHHIEAANQAMTELLGHVQVPGSHLSPPFQLNRSPHHPNQHPKKTESLRWLAQPFWQGGMGKKKQARNRQNTFFPLWKHSTGLPVARHRDSLTSEDRAVLVKSLCQHWHFPCSIRCLFKFSTSPAESNHDKLSKFTSLYKVACCTRLLIAGRCFSVTRTKPWCLIKTWPNETCLSFGYRRPSEAVLAWGVQLQFVSRWRD